MKIMLLNCETAHLICSTRLCSSLIKNCVSIEERNPFILQYISWPEFGLNGHSCMNTPVTQLRSLQ